MKKNKKIKISDFFGTSFDYYLFGIKSFYSLFRLCTHIGNRFNRDFFYLDKVEINEIEQLHFHLLYAQISEIENIHFAILENKTPHFLQYNTNNVEKKLSFRTLSLFEDNFYIFNRKGLKLFYTPHLNLDFLLFIFLEKDRDISEVISEIETLPKITLHDMSSVLMNIQQHSSSKPLNFIRNLFYDIQIKSEKILEEKKTQLIYGKQVQDKKFINKEGIRLDLINPSIIEENMNSLFTETGEEDLTNTLH